MEEKSSNNKGCLIAIVVLLGLILCVACCGVTVFLGYNIFNGAARGTWVLPGASNDYFGSTTSSSDSYDDYDDYYDYGYDDYDDYDDYSSSSEDSYSSSAQVLDPDFSLTTSGGETYAFELPSDWELSVDDGRYPTSEQPCYNLGDFNDNTDCDPVVLAHRDYPDEYGYQVAFSQGGVLHWGGGSISMATVTESINFLGDNMSVPVSYQANDPVNLEPMMDRPALYVFCNTDDICFSADLKNLSLDEILDFAGEVKALWREIRVERVD